MVWDMQIDRGSTIHGGFALFVTFKGARRFLPKSAAAKEGFIGNTRVRRALFSIVAEMFVSSEWRNKNPLVAHARRSECWCLLASSGIAQNFPAKP
jgi:hypothetical protein